MEFITLLLPFFVAGIIAAILSKLTGITMSMVLVPALLYLGAKPLEVVSFMFLFVLYNNFTVETQDVRLDFKNLMFFKGWTLIIPILIVIALAFFFPVVSIGLFVLYFIAELGAALYRRLPERQRPSKAMVIKHVIIASITTLIGACLVPFIPSFLYFGFAGLAILIITGFAWYAGKHRDAFSKSWDYIWSALHLLFGAFGVEASRYPKALQRTFKGGHMETMMPLVTVFASFFGLIVMYLMNAQFSLPAFAGAIGSAFTIRIIGLYQFSKSGGFSLGAAVLAVALVICLYLVSPQATGFDVIYQVFSQPIG